MCGIFGIISQDKISSSMPIPQDLLRHRGPDAFGSFFSKNHKIYFAHWRLSIIDLNASANQPMISFDGRYTIIYNGEIYNYKELRELCFKKGSTFKTKSDTEVIFELIRHYGAKKGIAKLRGMWAFAILDNLKQQVILSRDHFGVKPLYYGIKDGALYFASEIKALKVIDSYFCEPDSITQEIFESNGYLDRGEWTFYKNVKRFPQYHYALISLNRPIAIKPLPYWNYSKVLLDISYQEAIKQLRRLLFQSVKRHLVSDVPIAIALSGGLDSSCLVSLARQLNHDSKIVTFTTTYPQDMKIDETKWAKKIINCFKTEAHFIEPKFEDFMQDFSTLIGYHDEPFGSTSVFAQYYIFKSVRESGFKICIDGQGADEIFGGYHTIMLRYVLYLLQKKQYLKAIEELFFIVIKYPSYLVTFPLRFIYSKIIRLCSSRNMSAQTLERLKSINPKIDSFEEYLAYLTINHNLPQLLRSADRNSMANSVESRVPFLDVDLVEFVLSLPAEYKIKRAITKRILRDALVGFVPKEVIERKDKKGFPTPEKKWLELGFGLNVNGPFTQKWRKFIISYWLQNGK